MFNARHVFATLAVPFAMISLVPGLSVAQNRPSPKPVYEQPPTFSCSVDTSAWQAVVTKTNTSNVPASTNVVATVNGPTGPINLVLCGSAFQTSSTAKIGFNKPTGTDPNFVFTCSAKMGTGPCPETVK